MQIRKYTDADWPSVWEVVTAGEPFAYDPGWSSEQARDVWVETPPGHTGVARDGARARHGAHGTQTSRPRIARLDGKLHGRQHRAGRGSGGALGEYALVWAREQGYYVMQFNAVVESNDAVRLWQALGFRILGTVPEAFKHPSRGRVGLHVMHRHL